MTASPALPVLCTIVVLFHPSHAMIDQLVSLEEAGLAPIAVINAASADTIDRLEKQITRPLIINASNVGLAKAMNQGISRALSDGADYVLLLDQDSVPDPDMAKTLIATAERLAATGIRLGAIGPKPIDRKRPDGNMFRGQRLPDGLYEVDTLISSGTLIPRAALMTVGGMWEDLFIDHVDHEWCFRARAAGLAIRLSEQGLLLHDLGNDGVVIRGHYKPLQRSPLRHYHIVRNTLWMARRSFIPARWRRREILKLLVRIPLYLAVSTDRAESLWTMIRAIRDGLAPRMAVSSPSIPMWRGDATAG